MFIVCFVSALILGLIFTPVTKSFALKVGIVDSPNTVLKNHKKATPYLGGISIALSFLLTLFSITQYFKIDIEKGTYAILTGSLILIFIGVVDDIKNIPPVKKLGFQSFAATIVVLSGLVISLTEIQIVNVFLTIFWIVALTNAFNLIDIMDGLAAGTAMIVSIIFAILFLQLNEEVSALLLLALAGSCFGFLKYNFNPAQIFMGDAGSLFLGYLLACESIIFINESPVSESKIILFFVFGIPIFEMTFITILRIKSKRSPLLGSKDHFALRMIKSGYTVKQTTAITYVVGVLLGAAAILSFNFKGVTIYFLLAILLSTSVIAGKLSKINMNN